MNGDDEDDGSLWSEWTVMMTTMVYFNWMNGDDDNDGSLLSDWTVLMTIMVHF